MTVIAMRPPTASGSWCRGGHREDRIPEPLLEGGVIAELFEQFGVVRQQLDEHPLWMLAPADSPRYARSKRRRDAVHQIGQRFLVRILAYLTEPDASGVVEIYPQSQGPLDGDLPISKGLVGEDL
jgi:hypothetical protein